MIKILSQAVLASPIPSLKSPRLLLAGEHTRFGRKISVVITSDDLPTDSNICFHSVLFSVLNSGLSYMVHEIQGWHKPKGL